VLTLEFSKCGLGFLHSEQLFPGELIEVCLPDKSPQIAEITGCRKLGQRCYRIGARLREPGWK
jgi:hypothetical protein